MLLEYGAAQSDCEAVSVPPVNIRVGPELEAGPNVYSSALLVVRGNPMLTAWWPSEAISTTCLGVIDKITPKVVFLTSITIGGSEQTSWTTFAFLATLMPSRLGTDCDSVRSLRSGVC